MNVRTKKKILFSFCVHLSLQPHFLSHTMDLLQRPSFFDWFCRKQNEKERKERRKTFSPLPSAVVLFSLSLSLSLVREDLSLCARAKLLGDRSEIADDEDTAEQYSYSSFARAREKAPNLLLGEEEEEEHTRGENSNVFFFPENDARGRERRKTKR